jgi:AraC family transcriptional regulator
MKARNPDRIVFESPIVKVGEFRCAVDHPRFTETGRLDDYCFVFPRNACWIEHEGQRAFVADSTTVPLYNPGRAYRRSAIDPSGDFTDWFSVSPDVLREMVATFDPGTADDSDQLFTRGFIGASSDMFLAQRQVFNYITQHPIPDVLVVEESVIGVLSDVVSRTYDDDSISRAVGAAVAARVRAHLGRTFLLKESVGELSAAIGVSPFHLCRVFRRETGYSIHRYRTELRLRWSLQPLADGVDILTVALAAGFSHHSHFTAAFHRTFGLRPAEFRRSAKPSRAKAQDLRSLPSDRSK